MFPSFLPAAASQLTESESIALAQSIQSQAIATPLTRQPITTTYAHLGSGGTPILLIHGFDSSILEFRRLLPLLAADNQTWAVDLLGFGFTDRLAGIKFSPSAIKTHLYYFWKTLINQSVILVGASMGGATAIDFTLTYPEVVQKLVLIDSAGLRGGSLLSKLMFPPLGYLATEFLRNPQVRDRVSRAAYKNPSLVSVDALNCAALHLQMQSWSQATIAFTKSGGYSAFRFKKLSEIKQPTLILWGDSDKILGTEDAKRFKRAIPQSQLIWIPDCGHLPHLEQPKITARHILEFRG
ncbi:alpha/beta hydrolase [Nostocaceae cyanobacterium CENA369]|uniref:Alpha/beta hydrolase n=1 Tax=Dendronalium phyllosphericum CENA369 TaxID=1725256 RepID=A0A8J7I4R5_9NOST|nr:alpha/beta hydrolase [Dendronalium phyllosphericum]MBH8573978.1 alpha/beta hydrolase [Dendronalium phyllosphericum CENA369]